MGAFFRSIPQAVLLCLVPIKIVEYSIVLKNSKPFTRELTWPMRPGRLTGGYKHLQVYQWAL
jgi:hypothetical protein